MSSKSQNGGFCQIHLTNYRLQMIKNHSYFNKFISKCLLCLKMEIFVRFYWLKWSKNKCISKCLKMLVNLSSNSTKICIYSHTSKKIYININILNVSKLNFLSDLLAQIIKVHFDKFRFLLDYIYKWQITND